MFLNGCMGVLFFKSLKADIVWFPKGHVPKVTWKIFVFLCGRHSILVDSASFPNLIPLIHFSSFLSLPALEVTRWQFWSKWDVSRCLLEFSVNDLLSWWKGQRRYILSLLPFLSRWWPCWLRLHQPACIHRERSRECQSCWPMLPRSQTITSTVYLLAACSVTATNPSLVKPPSFYSLLLSAFLVFTLNQLQSLVKQEVQVWEMWTLPLMYFVSSVL